MRIGIDLRSLGNKQFTGVENYTVNVVENLLKLDKNNQYVLFYNSFKNEKFLDFHYLNSEIIKSRIPNKLLNLLFKFNLRSVENFTGKLDYFFMPNLGPISLMPQTPLAITVHDLSPVVAPEFYNLKRRIWHKFLNYKKAYKEAKIIFAVSEYTKQELIRIFKLPENKIIVAYPGVETQDGSGFEPEFLRIIRNTYQLPGKYILFLNTIEPRKNLLNLLKAYETLPEEDCYLVIAGRKGWKYNTIFKNINKSRKKNKIKYLGYLPENHKAAVIKLADVLVYTSFYEGFGFQPLEAFTLGTPVIASQVTSLPEVTSNGALLINPQNSADITNALAAVLNDKVLRNGLINRGHEQITKFSWRKTAEQMLQHFQNLK